MRLELSRDEIRPIVEECLEAVLACPDLAGSERLGFTEQEAAALMGVPRHTLRDCRLRGEIHGRAVGNKIVYSRQELMRFLATPKKRR